MCIVGSVQTSWSSDIVQADRQCDSGTMILIILSLSCCMTGVSGLTGVFATCPDDFQNPDGFITITAKSDEKLWQAYGFCEPNTARVFGSYQFYSHGDTVTKTLNVHFNTTDPDKCRFIETNRRQYTVYVQLYFPFGDKPYKLVCESPRLEKLVNGTDVGENGASEEGANKDEIVTNSVAVDIIATTDMSVDVTLASAFLHVPKGGPSRSDLALYLVDIKNKPLGDRKWRFGRYLKLAAELVTPNGKDESFQVHTCMALAVGSGQKQLIIKNGCGDGIVFPEDMGFVTTGRVAYSVPFKGFHLKDSIKTVFMCTFILCQHNCDGSSCEHELLHPRHKPKREAPFALYADVNVDNDSRKFQPAESPNMLIVREIAGTSKPIDGFAESSQMEMISGVAFCLSLLSIVITISLIASRWLSIRPDHTES